MWASFQWPAEVELGQQDRVLDVERRVGGRRRRPRSRHSASCPGATKTMPGHAHRDVLDVLEVAVVHVRAGVQRTEHVGEVTPDRHRDRGLRNAVVERDGVAEAVPVQGVRVDQVGACQQTEVAERDPQLLADDALDDRRRDLRLALLGLHLAALETGDVAEAEDVGVERRRSVRSWMMVSGKYGSIGGSVRGMPAQPSVTAKASFVTPAPLAGFSPAGHLAAWGAVLIAVRRLRMPRRRQGRRLRRCR